MAAAARLHHAKHRREDGLFLAEGPQCVTEALAADAVVTRLFSTVEAADRHPDLLRAAAVADVPITLCDDTAMARLATAANPAGLVAICRTQTLALAQALDGVDLAVGLWQASDPGNVGTIIRTADAAGAGAVVLTTDSVDVYNDKCVRSTAGSLFHLPIVSAVESGQMLDAARTAGLSVVATSASGRPLNAPDVAAVIAGPVFWLFGSEAHGLPEEALAAADTTVAVPIYGRAESLNLAAAAAVCLYASAMARKSAGP